MSRSHLLGWTTLACAFAALAFHWHSPPSGQADPGGNPDSPRQVFKNAHTARNPSQTTSGISPRQRTLPRPAERSPHGSSKPPSKPADFAISVPEGTPEDVANTARWIDATARKRLEEMTDRYRLTPAQQERVFPILARNLPGYTEQMTVSPAPRFGFAGPGFAGAADRIMPGTPATTAHNPRKTPPASNGNSGHPEIRNGPHNAGNTTITASQTGSRSTDSSVKRPNPGNITRQPGSPGDLPTKSPPPATAPASQDDLPGISNNPAPGPDAPQATDLPPPTLEDELFALLDPDQQALMMDDALDEDRWWHEIIGQLESELNDIISSGLPSSPLPDSPSDFEAPDDNLFDLLGN